MFLTTQSFRPYGITATAVWLKTSRAAVCCLETTTHAARSNGKHPGGRPTKYRPAFCQQVLTFCSRKPYRTLRHVAGEDGKLAMIRQANDPPLLIDFARKVRVHLATLYDWEKVHPEFHEALEQARELQHKYYLTCGVLGLTNSTITTLILKNNHGYKDRDVLASPPPSPAPKFIFNIGTGKTFEVDTTAVLASAAGSTRIASTTRLESTNGDQMKDSS